MHQNALLFRMVCMKDIELPQNLRSNILLSIRLEEKKQAKQLLATSLFTAIISFGAIVVSIKYALLAFYHSSFYSYATLLLSDPDVVVQYWQEFSLALLESLPVVGIVICLVAVCVFLFSLKLFAQSQRFVFTPSLAN